MNRLWHFLIIFAVSLLQIGGITPKHERFSLTPNNDQYLVEENQITQWQITQIRVFKQKDIPTPPDSNILILTVSKIDTDGRQTKMRQEFQIQFSNVTQLRDFWRNITSKNSYKISFKFVNQTPVNPQYLVIMPQSVELAKLPYEPAKITFKENSTSSPKEIKSVIRDKINNLKIFVGAYNLHNKEKVFNISCISEDEAIRIERIIKGEVSYQLEIQELSNEKRPLRNNIFSYELLIRPVGETEAQAATRQCALLFNNFLENEFRFTK